MTAEGFLAAGLSRLDQVMQRYVERAELPGIVCAVERCGAEPHVIVRGKLAQEGARAMTRDTIFRISSMTKPITAVAALMLLEECKLRLDDSVDALLPELAKRRVLRRLDGPLDDTVPAKRAITVRDVITFRLGFGMVMAPPDRLPIVKAALELLGGGPPGASEMPPPDEWLRRLGTLPLMHQPGEKWMYETGAEVLAILIARASGKSFPLFLRERIFEPLGMKDTGFSVPPEKRARFADQYLTDPETNTLIPFDKGDDTSKWAHPPTFPSGGSGLVSTLDDYLAFARMLLGHGQLDGQRLLSRPSVELMTSDQLTPEQKAVSGLMPGDFDDCGYGMGVSVVTRRSQLDNLGTYGWDGGLGSSWRNDPKERLTGILLTQRAWSAPKPPPICRDFWTLAYQALAA